MSTPNIQLTVQDIYELHYTACMCILLSMVLILSLHNKKLRVIGQKVCVTNPNKLENL